MEMKSTSNPYEVLKIAPNPDGSIKRLVDFPTTDAAPESDDPPSSVLTKDVQLNPELSTWLRIFLPRLPEDISAAGTASPKLPLIVYFHGGGFILCSAASTVFHDFCSEMALHLPAVIVSVDHRLAPEHRLPAAYDDAVEALRWIQRSEDEWILRSADLSRCFVMGTSAGGNIAYHAGLRLAEAAVAGDLEPVKIGGLILHHPFFGGSRRTESEMRLVDDSVLPMSAWDLMWELSLPIGADRDHEYCNPMAAGESDDDIDHFGLIKKLGWRILMLAGCEDPLVDWQAAVAKMMERKGVPVEAVFGDGDSHGVELGDPTKAKALFGNAKQFMNR